MGSITCSAENVVGKVSRNFSLIVNCKRPRYYTLPHSLNLMCVAVYYSNGFFLSSVMIVSFFFQAAPIIVKFEIRQGFYWCIDYEIKGYPTPNRTWFFNGEKLLYSNDITDVFHIPSERLKGEKQTDITKCLLSLFTQRNNWLLT